MSYVTIQTDEGTLRGTESAGVLRFLGVPYGADTGGRNRFLPPQPVVPWEGVRDAFEFGPSAPQPDIRGDGNFAKALSLLNPRGGSPLEGGAMSEDCLRLNVWAPAGRAAGSLPVIVWLHGGGFTNGSGSETAFHGDILAPFGEVVVVTVTHRLGALGFLDLRELGVSGSANAGMLDIVAALGWVQRNVAGVGGDPSRATVCGQSGGSGKVSALTAMPVADGLFQRCIMMSGPVRTFSSVEDASALRRRVIGALGVVTVEELRAVSVEEMLDAQREAVAGLKFPSPALDHMPGFGPSHDGTDLPRDPFIVDAPDGLRGKQLMIGWTSHDAALLILEQPGYGAEMGPDQLISLLETFERRVAPRDRRNLRFIIPTSRRICIGPVRSATS